MQSRVVVSLHYVVTSVLFGIMLISVVGQLQRFWHIDIGTSPARIFTAQLRESESAVIDHQETTFQWSRPNSSIPLPLHQPQIITMRTFMRVEEPPRAVTFTHAHRSFPLTITPGVRTYRFYSTSATQVAITCDMQGITTQEYAEICIALDWMSGQPITATLDASQLAWMIILFGMICGLAWIIATPARPWQIWLIMSIGVTLSLNFLQQSIMFAPQLSIGVGCIGFTWWSIRRSGLANWQQISAQAMVLNIAIKGLGVLVPGYIGTDLFFHVNRFVSVFSGRLYQIADGQGQTYPYPPGIYQILAPVVLPFMTIFPPQLLLIIGAVIIDSSTIILLAWMCHRLAWSERSISLMAWSYVILPAGFLLQWQATIAQTVGQWLGMMAIATALWRVTPVSLMWMAWAVVGHFGAFLTLHLAHTIAFGFAELRRMAWWWWGVVVVMGCIFYSQYIALILDQLRILAGDDTSKQTDWVVQWWRYAWNYGIYGHYMGIGLGLALIGLWLAPRDRWWQMSIAMMITFGVLLVAQVFGDFGATRYVIFIFPVVASFAGVAFGRLRRSRAGHVMCTLLLAYIALQSGIAWFNGTLFGDRIGFLW